MWIILRENGWQETVLHSQSKSLSIRNAYLIFKSSLKIMKSIGVAQICKTHKEIK